MLVLKPYNDELEPMMTLSLRPDAKHAMCAPKFLWFFTGTKTARRRFGASNVVLLALRTTAFM
jgi:hypothetical protein